MSAIECPGLARGLRGSAGGVHADDLGVGKPDGRTMDLGAGMPPA